MLTREAELGDMLWLKATVDNDYYRPSLLENFFTNVVIYGG